MISRTVCRNDTYDHRTLKTRLPVRSALFKQRTGGLVVRWVTTSEYPLLYVFGSYLPYPFCFVHVEIWGVEYAFWGGKDVRCGCDGLCAEVKMVVAACKWEDLVWTLHFSSPE
jgi:hypothetical protein